MARKSTHQGGIPVQTRITQLQQYNYLHTHARTHTRTHTYTYTHTHTTPCMIRASCSSAEFCSDCSNEVALTTSNNFATVSLYTNGEGGGGGGGGGREEGGEGGGKREGEQVGERPTN